ncbi:MAG: hypothetical protein GY841_13155, partial [FCB group bacterium]|nr:hypothetical protein [FCB group bacterium]
MIKDLLKLVGIGVILFAAGFLLKSISVAESTAQAANQEKVLTIETNDGLKLFAWQIEAVIDSTTKGKRPGLALLLPMMRHTHESYAPFTSELHKIGYTTIAFDMRGHGLSTKVHGETLTHDKMGVEQFARMPSDIEAMFKDFKAKNPNAYNYDDVIVIGASIGANTAGILMRKPWLQKCVLLSPGRDYRGLKPEEVMAVKGGTLGKQVYIAAGIDDTYSAESSQWLYDNYLG